MPSFEEEAFTRAQQMNRRSPFYNSNSRQSQKPEQREEPKPEPPEKEAKQEKKFD